MPFRFHARSLSNIRRIGTPAANPAFQAESTTYLRVFVTSRSQSAVLGVAKALKDISLKHFSGTSLMLLLPIGSIYIAVI